MKNRLNPKIKEIVSAIYRYYGQRSAHEISKKTGISYLTVQKYLGILVDKGIISKWKDVTVKKKSDDKIFN